MFGPMQNRCRFSYSAICTKVLLSPSDGAHPTKTSCSHSQSQSWPDPSRTGNRMHHHTTVSRSLTSGTFDTSRQHYHCGVTKTCRHKVQKEPKAIKQIECVQKNGGLFVKLVATFQEHGIFYCKAFNHDLTLNRTTLYLWVVLRKTCFVLRQWLYVCEKVQTSLTAVRHWHRKTRPLYFTHPSMPLGQLVRSREGLFSKTLIMSRGETEYRYRYIEILFLVILYRYIRIYTILFISQKSVSTSI